MALDPLTTLRVAALLCALGVASYMDWRTRKVKDAIWLALGAIGLPLLAWDAYAAWGAAPSLLLLAPIAIAFFDPYWDRPTIYSKKDGVYWPAVALLAAFIGVISVVAALWFDPCAIFLFVVLAMLCVFHLLFHLRVLHGGADAKAMLAISLVTPRYPMFDPLPLIAVPPAILPLMEMAFPFALLVLMDAALATLVVPLVNLVRNAARRELSMPEALFGYKMKLLEVPKRFVWPMERVENGERVVVLFPSKIRDYREDLIKLRDAGADRIWVTPKLPFIVAILAGFVLALVLGNPVMWLLKIIMR
ncbi:MAG: hypothetical protein HZB92_00325 [Euryarchaeota archaeon]|nr:hypothetical protein [Euryarchaeota archaeon]